MNLRGFGFVVVHHFFMVVSFCLGGALWGCCWLPCLDLCGGIRYDWVLVGTDALYLLYFSSDWSLPGGSQ
jgi:hypothetical protein